MSRPLGTTTCSAYNPSEEDNNEEITLIQVNEERYASGDTDSISFIYSLLDYSTCKAVLETKETNKKIEIISGVLNKSIIVLDGQLYNFTPDKCILERKTIKKCKDVLAMLIRNFVSLSFQETLKDLEGDVKRRAAFTADCDDDANDLIDKLIKGEKLVRICC